MSKEKTHSTLVLISKDEAASHIKVTATQAFEVKTQEDSSGEESDGSDTQLDYEDVLPDEGDEEADHTADGGMTDGDGTQMVMGESPRVLWTMYLLEWFNRL